MKQSYLVTPKGLLFHWRERHIEIVVTIHLPKGAHCSDGLQISATAMFTQTTREGEEIYATTERSVNAYRSTSDLDEELTRVMDVAAERLYACLRSDDILLADGVSVTRNPRT